ncbi:MAG: UbiA family prenyltransferase [Thermoanaerobaculia bacterium]
MFVAWVRTLRPHQWSKNALILIPMLLAHEFGPAPLVIRAVLAMVLFSLTSSAIYVLNDLVDRNADRHHATKRNRPLASGALPTAVAVATIPVLLAVALTLSAVFLPDRFVGILAIYGLAGAAYSLFLKRRVIIDVVTLAALYVLRLVAGGAATNIPVSEWLLAFSMFFFLSLAFVKRYAELIATSESDPSRNGRGYLQLDAELIRVLGPVSGYISVLVLALYITGDSVTHLYSRPGMLWLAGPCLLYWLSRLWVTAHRGQLYGDPVVHALADPTSWLTLGAIVAIAFSAAIL